MPRIPDPVKPAHLIRQGAAVLRTSARSLEELARREPSGTHEAAQAPYPKLKEEGSSGPAAGMVAIPMHKSPRRFHRIIGISFLFADLSFILAHLVLGLLIFEGIISIWPDIWNINEDWSFGEMLNYIKWAILASLMIVAFVRERAPLFVALAFLFVVALADDSLQLHENQDVYAYLVELIGKPGFGWDQQHEGEFNWTFALAQFVVWGALALVVIGPLALGWYTANNFLRWRVFPMIWLLAGVVFCAVVFDFIHMLLPWGSIMAGVMGVLEDGGEMLFLTALVSYAAGTFPISSDAD